jgi:spore coat protein H
MNTSQLGGWVLTALVASLVAACGSTAEVTRSGTGGTGGAAGSAGQGGAAGVDGACGPIDGALGAADATDLFGYATVPAFDLYLPAADWANLQANARDETYVEAQACFEGRSIGRVGLRFKGNVGSLFSCFDETGANTCRKLSMKLKFDEYDVDQRFYGLKRLNFQAYRYDDSYLKERLAYDTFRAMGVVAPRAAWALLRVNDEPQGLFGMVEQIDGRFTSDRWPATPDGNLYKEVWPIRTDVDWVTGRLETNEDVADVSAMVAFSEAMLAASDADLRTTLGSYTDLDTFARYMAVDDAIANYDGVTAYYSAADALWSGNHNFYFYEAAPDRYTIVPWDLESSMIPFLGFGDVPRWTEVPADCSQTYPVWSGQNQVLAPGCDRVFRALAADLTSYRAAGAELLAGPFAEGALESAIDQHAAFIREQAIADPHGPGATGFENYVSYLRAQMPFLRQRFERLLSGEPWVSLEIDTAAVTDFELQDDFGISMGPTFMSNAASTVSVAINAATPLVGTQDVVMSFEYGNETTPWQQWSFYRVPMLGGAADVRSLSGIRLWLRADEARTLRLDLDSQAESKASEGIRVGWDVPVTATGTQIEVRFANAAVVGWAVQQGRDPGDDPQSILATVSGLVFQPLCVGRDATGQLPAGTVDAGFLEIDDIEFF